MKTTTTVDRVLVGAFSSVVLTFLAASWLGQHRANQIEQAALSIHGNAAPSIRRLAGARAELRHLQLLVHRALDEPGASNRLTEIERARGLLDQEVTEYTRLPMYPGEAAAWQQAEHGIARLDADLDTIVGAIARADTRTARVGQDRLDASSEAVARALSNAIDVNVAAAARLAAEIGDSRRAGIRWTMLLDAIGVAFASLATALALRISRAHSRAVEAYRHIAEQRAEELEHFAGRMAHDVRTPLATVGLSIGAAEKYGGDDPRFRRALTRANRGFAQALKIIDALFEFARSGARPDPTDRASVAEAAEDTVCVLQTRADEIGADIIVHSTSRSLVPCSPGVLSSALVNLVGNALTYVEGATTRCVTIEITDEGEEVKTTVADTGPGLPSGADPAALFQPYVRGEGARGRGMGLGLATVKRIVEAHGGNVGVRSSPRGCVFWFTLPRSGGA